MSIVAATIELISWNVNGLRACRKKGFDEFIRERNPDVVCLQEVKLNPSCIPEDDFGYAFHRYHLAEKPGYSGTAVFSKEEPLNISTDLPEDSSHSGEGRVITCEFDGFHLVNTYVPNAKGDLSRLEYRHRSWDPALRSHLQELRKTKPVILCGDLNVAHMEIDLANPRANRTNAGFTNEEREGMSTLLEDGFLDTFRHLHPDLSDAYSWWSYRAGARARNIGWRLDYFIASEELCPSLRDAFILPEVHGSDHCPVGIRLTRG